MKKTHIIILLVIASIGLNAQSFHKRAVVVDLNAGVEVYNTVLNLKIKDPSRTLDTSNTDKAANTNFSLGAEFGLHKHFGIGFRVKANKYLAEKDSVTNIKPLVKSNDFAVVLNWHPVVIKKFDLILGADIGYSAFKYMAKDSLNLIISGGGSYVSFYLNPRIYFGRFGINFKAYAPFTNYSNLITNNQDFNNYITITKWKGSGFGLSAGIQVRF